jgi:hypothetical protein
MTTHKGGRTVHVVRTTDSEVEVFATADEAWQYARCKRGATVLERTVRASLGEAQIVYERRVHIVDGVVRRDTITEEPFFTVGVDSWIQSCDVESFEAKDARWTIVGLGTDRARIDELVEREIARLIATPVLSLSRRDPA